MDGLVENFHFLRPWWFLALLPSLAIGISLIKKQMQPGQWQNIVAPHILPFLIDGVEKKQRKIWVWGLITLWTITVFALAGPAWKKLPQKVERNTAALVIVWDLSPSMLAEDIKPSRVERSRLKIIELLENRSDGLTALIAFAGEAHVVTPLTDDIDTIINLLPGLGPATLPSSGSNPEMAFDYAEDLLKNANIARGDILMITDEIDASAIPLMEAPVESSNHQLTLWGVGSTAGAPIALPQGGFYKNADGSVALVKLNETEIRNFAARTGSYYVPMVQNDRDIQTLVQLISRVEQDNDEEDEEKREFDQWYEHGQYLTLLILPFLALGFRRGWLLSLLFVFPLLGAPQYSYANSIDTLFKNEDQRAKDLLRSGDAESAAETFEHPDWKGTAHFIGGNYEAAADAFRNNQSAEGQYNLGNSLTFAGEYDEAIAAFDRALALDPDFAPAQNNRAIAEKLKSLAQNSQANNQQSGEEGESQENQNSDSQDSGDSDQSQQGQQNEQQASDPQNGSQDGQQNEAQQTASENENSGAEENTAAQNSEQNNNTDKNSEYDYQYPQEQEEQKDQESQSQIAEQTDEENDSDKDGEQNSIAEEGEENSDSSNEQLAQEDQSQINYLQEKNDKQETGENTERKPLTMEELKLQQWLRKVEDDPSGLLREKFRYQYQQRRQRIEEPRNLSPAKAPEKRL